MRIFKCSKFIVKLLVPQAEEIEDMNINLFTDDVNVSADFTSGYSIENNTISLIVPNYAVCNLNDGVLSYIVSGKIDDKQYMLQRQSNYFLKSPTKYSDCDIATINEVFVDDGDGIMIINSNDYGVDGFSKVEIDATKALEEKYEQGYKDGSNDIDDDGDDCPECPELNEITISENGTYEGAFNKVIVEVPQEGGNCNLGQLRENYKNLSYNDSEIWAYASDFGVDGFDYVHIEYGDLREEIENQTKEKIKNELESITITENGTYYPPKTKLLNMDFDDAFELGEFNKNICIELHFIFKAEEQQQPQGVIFGSKYNDRLMGISYIGGTTINLQWGKYSGNYPLKNGENVIVIKPYDENNKIIINGSGYGVGDYEEDVDFNIPLYLGGLEYNTSNFKFISASIWNNYTSYNNGEEPEYKYYPNENSILKNDEVISNYHSDAIAQIEEIGNILGFKEIKVDVKNKSFGNLGNFLIPLSHYGDSIDSKLSVYIEKNNPIDTYGIMSEIMKDQNNLGYPAIIGSMNFGNALQLNNIFGDNDGSYNDILYVGNIKCDKIITTNNAFKNCNFYLNRLTELGKSFHSEQEVVLPKYNISNYGYYNLYEMLLELVESLHNFSLGPNEYGVTTSTLLFPNSLSRDLNDDVRQKITEMGWNYSTY